MVGHTLYDIRRSVESLETDDGVYHIICARTGTSPVPIAGRRFDSRHTARAALRFAEQYRAALRRYDPQLPYHDLIVCEAPETYALVGETAGDTTALTRREDESTADGSVTDRQPLIDFCHDVTGALFETLADEGYERVERAVMDVYLDAAESVADRDEFCLVLLESMVVELTDQLSTDEQQHVLEAASRRMPPVEDDGRTIETALQRLVSVSIASDYHLTPLDDTSSRGWLVTLSEYALDGDERYLPTLPLAIELNRILPDPVSIEWARAVDTHDWELRLSTRDPTKSTDTGLLRATIRDT